MGLFIKNVQKTKFHYNLKKKLNGFLYAFANFQGGIKGGMISQIMKNSPWIPLLETHRTKIKDVFYE